MQTEPEKYVNIDDGSREEAVSEEEMTEYERYESLCREPWPIVSSTLCTLGLYIGCWASTCTCTCHVWVSLKNPAYTLYMCIVQNVYVCVYTVHIQHTLFGLDFLGGVTSAS